MHHLSRLLARLMVGGALIAALILAVAHGFDKGAAWHIRIALVIGLACVAVGEFLSWHNAATSWHERRLGSVLLWGMLGGLLSAGTLYTNFSTTAGNNDAKAGVHKTAYVVTTNAAQTGRELEAKVNRLAERMRMKPQRDPVAAAQAQTAAKGDPRWKLTAGCTDIKGPNTRVWCGEYASAIADEKLGTELIATAADLEVAERELKTLRAEQASRPATVSDDQASVHAVAAFLHVDARTARQADGMVLPLLVQAMLLLGGICLANEAYRQHQRRAWLDWPKWSARWRRMKAAVEGRAVELPQPASARFHEIYGAACRQAGVRNLIAA